MYTLSDLFEQLGLPSDEADIDAFVAEQGPLAKDEPMTEASFWTESQRKFFQEMLREDSEWAIAIDELNTRLH